MYTYLGTKLALISVHPSNQVVTLLTSTEYLSLTCEAVGVTSYYWERQNGSIPSSAIGVDSKTLTLLNLTPQDAGDYRCEVSDGSHESISNYAKITVNG